MIGLGEGAESEGVAQRVQLIVTGRCAGRIVGEGTRVDVQLLRHECDDHQRDQFAGPDQPTGKAQGGKLQGETETVVRSAAPGDERQVVGAEGVMADEVGLGGGQSEQGVELGFGEGATARNGGSCPSWSIVCFGWWRA